MLEDVGHAVDDDIEQRDQQQLGLAGRRSPAFATRLECAEGLRIEVTDRHQHVLRQHESNDIGGWLFAVGVGENELPRS